MPRLDRVVCLVTAGLLTVSAPAAAQLGDFVEVGKAGPGWTLHPALTTGLVFDDNVFIQSNIDSPASDLVATLNPSGSIDFSGKRNTFSAGYSGGFTGYQSFSTLNSFGQSGNVGFKRLLSAHTTFSVSQSASYSPSTDTQAIVGVPFVRLGSRVGSFGASIDSTLSRRTTITASYNAEIVRFDEPPASLGPVFVGGHTQGGSVSVRRLFSPRLSVTGDYHIQWSSVISAGGFSIQSASGGADYRLSEVSSVFTSVGFSRLVSTDSSQPTLLPIWRAGYSRAIDRANVEVTYGRDFVPSYGGGGTQANQELTGRLRYALGRRSYTQGGVTWRRDSTLAPTGPLLDLKLLPLTSLWMNGTFGYQLRQWAQLEVLYSGLGQKIDRPGGGLDRHTIGVQIAMAAPMRMK